MGSQTVLIVVLTLYLCCGHGLRLCYPSFKETLIDNSTDLGKPLYLTKLLEEGKFKKAQRLSKVKPAIGNTTSYAGYFTVNEECESNLFFWFFTAQKDNWEDAPLLLWLQGGPGCTSFMGLFEEMGPFESYEDGLKARPYSWNTENNLLIIDQPIGTGYSYSGKQCFATNDTMVGEDLYQAVKQFHMLFPSFQTNKFFIVGESYGGHYVPTLGHTILKYNSSTDVPINLVSMMIGNGMMDFMVQNDYANYLYQLGFIDETVKEEMQALYDECVVQLKAWDNATAIAYYCSYAFEDLYYEYVGEQVSFYNYLPVESSPVQNWDEFTQSPAIRKALHVGNRPFHWGGKANTMLTNGSLGTVQPWVEELLGVYPIVFYNGQTDIICNYPNMVKFLRSLSWSGQNQYLNATRSKWCVGDDLAGYFKGEHNLYEVLVRDAGHEVPKFQPLWAYVLINAVTNSTAEDPLRGLTKCASSGRT